MKSKSTLFQANADYGKVLSSEPTICVNIKYQRSLTTL